MTFVTTIVTCRIILYITNLTLLALLQVSHHPPMLATHVDGREWTTWQEFTMTTKFRGKYLQIIPMGKSWPSVYQASN